MPKIRSNKKAKQNPKSKIIIPIVVLALIFVTIGAGMSYFKKSLFTVMKVPDFELTNQNNQKISNKDMLGKVYLVEFFFSKCPTICPVMNSNMKHIEETINDKNFGIISISIDPTNDTPEVLKNHARMLGTKSPNWHFLTGNRDYIDNLADQFNIYVGDKEDQSESLNHSGMIALVDQEGNLRSRFDENNSPILYYSGLNYEDSEGKTTSLIGKYHPDREKLIEDIRKLLKQ
ncbi:SCO family protein [Epilithonimonas sp. JDS]|uniref:SCO family protein n=1 Tax=Epilithonimonas sp. JDS TaxID=2902797 RepID=UPI001E54C4A3|nr:SCO family protein [Epilithonimonas sp. JDS]MCD9853865.1 SCO family protein [Epilithonimonas sp. JDS]